MLERTTAVTWTRHRTTGEVDRVVEEQRLWGACVLRIWLPAADTVIRVAPDPVEPLDAGAGADVGWRLLAAAAGLGKTIEAGLAILELEVQGNASLSQVTRRVAEKWGNRSTLQRAVQRVSRSFVAWGVLQERSTRGVYESGRARLAIGSSVGRLLIEGLLLGGGRASLPLAELVRHVALFPFDVEVRGGELRPPPELRVDRRGLDVDVVTLPPGKPTRKATQQIALDFEAKE